MWGPGEERDQNGSIKNDKGWHHELRCRRTASILPAGRLLALPMPADAEPRLAAFRLRRPVKELSAGAVLLLAEVVMDFHPVRSPPSRTEQEGARLTR